MPEEYIIALSRLIFFLRAWKTYKLKAESALFGHICTLKQCWGCIFFPFFSPMITSDVVFSTLIGSGLPTNTFLLWGGKREKIEVRILL